MLIDFEGIDGSGKTTQARLIFDHLSVRGIQACLFREPTEGRYGRMIRDILSGKIPRRIPEEELDLFIKDRQENVARNIRPALSAGSVVLLDRYYYSTMAYQGAMGLDVERIRAMNESFAPKPDLVLIFILPVEEALRRIRLVRGNGTDSYEKEVFLRKVDAIFRSFKDKQVRHIDSARPLPKVHLDVVGILGSFISDSIQ